MAITVGVLYSNMKEIRTSALDRVALYNDARVPKVGVLAIVLSAQKDGRDTRVDFVDSKDNYILIGRYDSREIALYGWDDHDGGWYRVDNPFASDGYSRATIPPFLLPYKPDFDYWIFRGEQVDQAVWEGSIDLRSRLR